MAEGCAPSSVNDTYREGLAAQVRWFNRHHGLDNARALLSTAGGPVAYTLTFTTAPASFFTGFIFGCKINLTCSANPTMNVNGLGATAIQKMTSAGYVNLSVNDLITGQHVWFKYDATLARVILMTPTAAAGAPLSDVTTTRGDIAYRDATNALARLAIGGNGTFPRSNGTDLAYGAVALTTDVSGVLPLANGGIVSTVIVSGVAASPILADHGTMYIPTGAGFTLTLPSLAAVAAGYRIGLQNQIASGTCVANRSAADTIVSQGTAGLTSITLPSLGDQVWFVADTVNTRWFVQGKRSFTSAVVAWTTTATDTQAHSLGVRPQIYNSFIRNTTAELGYAIGDEVLMPQNVSDMTAVGRHKGFAVNATNGYTLQGTTATFPVMNLSAPAAGVNINTANWELRWRALVFN